MMRRTVSAVGILVIVLVAGIGGLHLVSAAPAVPLGPHALPTAAHLAPAPSVRPSAGSGSGTYFTTQSVPPPAASAQSCYGGTCVIAADDPSLNLTSQGYLVAAFTSWTTSAPCTAARPFALTEVGIVVSTNLGGSWSSPSYIGNPVCTTPTVGEYPSAWEPSLTSLANGTLVLAYIEYNVSNSSVPGGFPPGLSFHSGTPAVTFDRLVVTRSYDGGSTWSSPLAVNTSANSGLTTPAYPPQRPSITAIGDTVYLAWMNLTDSLNGAGTGSSAVHVVTSIDGGVTFGSPTSLRTVGSGATSIAMNPSLLVDGSGRLYAAYATNLTYLPLVGCLSSGCVYAGWSASVIVAVSTNNASSFTYTTVADNVGVPASHWGPFVDPSPTLAVNPTGAQVYVAYANSYIVALCSQYGCYTGVGSQISAANSSNDGATFSAPHVVDPALHGGPTAGSDLLYNPAIGVTSDGILRLTATFDNYSVCAPGAFGNFCGPQAEIYASSSDNGSTFSSPIYVSDNSTQLVYNPNNPDGEYASLVTAGSEVLLAWTSDVCYAWNTTLAFAACPWPGTGGASGIQISELYEGAGISLTFTETGLATGTPWAADLLGNVATASAPSSLVFGGIPAGLNVTWNVTVHSAYGYRYVGVFSSWNPVILTATTTVTVAYTSQVLFNLTTVPFLAPYPYGTPGCGWGAGFFWNLTACPSVNWNITPGPESVWVTPGTVIPLSVSPSNTFYCVPAGTCYSTDILNLTFLSWKGTGDSAANTTSFSTNVTVNGPVNETASFAFNGYCVYQWAPVFYTCVGPNETYAFHETGLPSGTSWGVTISSGLLSQSNQSTTPWNVFNSTLTATLLNYSVWTVPVGTTGNVYVATATPVSPIVAVTTPVVNVNFSLVPASSATFPVYVSTTNLPTGSSWSYSIGSTSFSSSTNAAAPVVVAGGSHSVGAASVVLANSTRYVPKSIDTLQYSGSGAWANFTTLPASLQVLGTTYASVTYSLQYWLEATASSCGSVSSSLGWYAVGTTAHLTATPSSGCIFLGWSGSGAGSVTTSQLSIAPIVGGPITELALFEPAAPPTWNVTLGEIGLPAGTSYSVGLGAQYYSGSATFTVRHLGVGVYALALPYAYLNGSDGARFVPTLVSTNLASVPGGYLVNANGWLNLSYTTQLLVGANTTTGGTVAPSGSAWYDTGASVTFVATPDAGQLFLGWTGSGPGAISSASATLSMLVVAPATEVASFGPIPVAVTNTFGVTVTESGLPTGTTWNVEIGTAGYGSAASSVATLLPNGTYEVVAPILPGPTGVRYVPSPMFTNVTVAGGASSAAVAYAAEFFVTLSASPGGSINVSSGWFPNSTVLQVSATPANSSELFGNWTGSGTGAYSGPIEALVLTVSAPISESAAFGPVPPAPTKVTSTTSSTDGLPIALGLLVLLLVVGLAVGYLLLRRRPPGPMAATTAPAEPEELYGETPPPETVG